ncbi:hypothetical protein [Streptomyces tanashiensis]|uniref:Glycine-rich domain-containing protein n=2 Tax=Streptomyces tanashiensis TaxID=67367 RepID=A0ABY6R9P9_9ACTN|nr:hypothetical protein [Streptomyces tanashiensis]UZX26805.1 hypothetical protein LDH80_37690 [Streptomyces tanashiensis]GGY34917.1 hypothetical protein GCM10010299_46830 [Streptomyces tanashiensis]
MITISGARRRSGPRPTCRTRVGIVGLMAMAGVLQSFATAAPAHALETWTYSTPGSYTVTVPSDVTYVAVSLTGGGGGGGGVGSGPAFGDGTVQPGGGGGGGGASSSCVLSVEPGDRITITVAAGGAGGPASGLDRDGASGGNSAVTVNDTAGGAGAQGGAGGHHSGNALPGTGGAGGDRGMSWCVGSFSNLYTGQAGAAANADTRAGGAGGAPGAVPPSSCGTGAGSGGSGGSGSANGLAHQYTESLPGSNGCVVLTY